MIDERLPDMAREDTMKKVMPGLVAVGYPMSPRSMCRAIIHNQRARCARGLTFRSISVAEHDLVSEVYHVIDGSGTLVLGPDILDMKRRPATDETVRFFNGPGNNGWSIRNGVSYQLKAGDVVIMAQGICSHRRSHHLSDDAHRS